MHTSIMLGAESRPKIDQIENVHEARHSKMADHRVYGTLCRMFIAPLINMELEATCINIYYVGFKLCLHNINY